MTRDECSTESQRAGEVGGGSVEHLRKSPGDEKKTDPSSSEPGRGQPRSRVTHMPRECHGKSHQPSWSLRTATPSVPLGIVWRTPSHSFHLKAHTGIRADLPTLGQKEGKKEKHSFFFFLSSTCPFPSDAGKKYNGNSYKWSFCVNSPLPHRKVWLEKDRVKKWNEWQAGSQGFLFKVVNLSDRHMFKKVYL